LHGLTAIARGKPSHYGFGMPTMERADRGRGGISHKPLEFDGVFMGSSKDRANERGRPDRKDQRGARLLKISRAFPGGPCWLAEVPTA
jgi:hypothetical protein